MTIPESRQMTPDKYVPPVDEEHAAILPRLKETLSDSPISVSADRDGPETIEQEMARIHKAISDMHPFVEELSPAADRPAGSARLLDAFEDVTIYLQHDDYNRCPVRGDVDAEFCTCGLTVARGEFEKLLRIVVATATSSLEIITEARTALGLKKGELLSTAIAQPVPAADRPLENSELQKAISEAIEVGLTAAYQTKSSGFLGGNVEERTKIGVTAGIQHYVAKLSRISEEGNPK